MPSLQVFDRLNVKNSGKTDITIRSMPISKYFGEMRLTKQQKKERISLANDIEDAMLFFFSLVILQREYSYMAAVSAIEIKEQFRKRMHDTVSKHTELTPELREYINDYVDDVTNTTTEHVEILLALMDDEEMSTPQKQEKRKSEEYYLSDDRARFLGEEEANTIFNNVDFWRAKRLGRTKKTWITMRDNLVRKTHMEVDDRTIPINDLFVVGNSVMRYPRDIEYGSMREIASCRCTVVYS